MARKSSKAFPDGIGERAVKASAWHRHASPFSLLLLGSIIVAAFTGVFGGTQNTPLGAQSAAVRLRLDTPNIIRNGELFETRIEVAASRPVGELVIAVTPAIWRDMTINTMIPAPVDETFADGAFRFSYGPLGMGDTLKVKIDGQVNPTRFGASTGSITVLDGDAVLVRLPVDIEVRP